MCFPFLVAIALTVRKLLFFAHDPSVLFGRPFDPSHNFGGNCLLYPAMVRPLGRLPPLVETG